MTFGSWSKILRSTGERQHWIVEIVRYETKENKKDDFKNETPWDQMYLLVKTSFERYNPGEGPVSSLMLKTSGWHGFGFRSVPTPFYDFLSDTPRTPTVRWFLLFPSSKETSTDTTNRLHCMNQYLLYPLLQPPLLGKLYTLKSHK